MTDLKLIWLLLVQSLKDWTGSMKCVLGFHDPVKMMNYRNGRMTTICNRCGKILK